jgi:hypothetical protein
MAYGRAERYVALAAADRTTIGRLRPLQIDVAAALPCCTPPLCARIVCR